MVIIVDEHINTLMNGMFSNNNPKETPDFLHEMNHKENDDYEEREDYLGGEDYLDEERIEDKEIKDEKKDEKGLKSLFNFNNFKKNITLNNVLYWSAIIIVIVIVIIIIYYLINRFYIKNNKEDDPKKGGYILVEKPKTEISNYKEKKEEKEDKEEDVAQSDENRIDAQEEKENKENEEDDEDDIRKDFMSFEKKITQNCKNNFDLFPKIDNKKDMFSYINDEEKTPSVISSVSAPKRKAKNAAPKKRGRKKQVIEEIPIIEEKIEEVQEEDE